MTAGSQQDVPQPPPLITLNVKTGVRPSAAAAAQTALPRVQLCVTPTYALAPGPPTAGHSHPPLPAEPHPLLPNPAPPQPPIRPSSCRFRLLPQTESHRMAFQHWLLIHSVQFPGGLIPTAPVSPVPSSRQLNSTHHTDVPLSAYLYPPAPHTSREGCCGRFRARGAVRDRTALNLPRRVSV